VAYDAIAVDYDRQIRGDEWMRRALHRHYLEVFAPGQRVLDVGCGTGIDALALARQGISVLGIDASPGMIAQLRARVEAAGLAGAVQGCVLTVADLASVRGQFDGAYSSFAPLSTADLGRFGPELARLVRPRGRVVLHLLNRFSLWEWLGLLARRQWRAAAQLPSRQARDFRIAGRDVRHQLYFAQQAYVRFFAPNFALRRRYGLGAVRPPHTVKRLPTRLVGGLEALDGPLGALPGVRDAGRFFVLDLERRPT
jgi:SAM-dependent methyltransferase